MAELVDKIRSGRRGSLINVYKLLLHSPPLAESWFDHLNQVRWGTQLSGRLREIVIIRIGYLNKVAYVLNQHVPKLAEAEGLSVAECDALVDWQDSDFFSADERAALAFADAMTRNVAVPDDVFDALRGFYDERRIVELAILIGTYNMQNRVLAALQIDLEPK
ncbi:MAG: carboxymuconolactone decarboxylase family protein [Proteobacteria bacterium]|nr:carboxymuconolactone decarboxylase family protein [Pseudomonadota bacterium]